MTEFRLYDDPGAEVAEIVTNGATIKPFLNAIEYIVDEAKIHINESGLSVAAISASNVFMGDVAIPADAFKTFDIKEETTIGVHIDNLQSAVRRARKNSDDELTLSIQQRRLTATVARGYDNHDVISQNTLDLIDPDSIREELHDLDIDRDVSVSLDAAAFTDALSHVVGGPSDWISLKTQPVNQHAKALYLSDETKTHSESIAISNIDTDGTAESHYSCDYMRKILGGIGEVDPETVTIIYDDEFPITVKMKSEDRPLTVRYLLSPRVMGN